MRAMDAQHGAFRLRTEAVDAPAARCII